MHLYLAGGENSAWLKAIEQAGVQKSLFSYFHLDVKDNRMRNVDTVLRTIAESQLCIFLDSGGFSAFTQGVEIDLDKYIEFIRRFEDILTVYANLDVIGDAAGTQRNQAYMEKRGLRPLPAFHFGSDLKVLKRMADKYDYLALGGLVPLAMSPRKLMGWLDRCFSVIRDQAKVHGFGMTGIPMLKRYPWYSVDSMSWLGGTMRGEIYTFKDGKLLLTKTTKEDSATAASMKYTDHGDKRWFQRVVRNAEEWKKMGDFITRLWAERGISWDA